MLIKLSSYKELLEFIRNNPTFTGIVECIETHPNGYHGGSYYYGYQHHYKNGKLHNENGPANFSVYSSSTSNINFNDDTSPCFYLFGNQLTKKAWLAAIQKGLQEDKLESNLRSRFEVEGMFWTKDFEYIGFKQKLIALRVFEQWYCLDKASRTNARITKEVNFATKNCKVPRIELSQNELETKFMESMKQLVSTF